MSQATNSPQSSTSQSKAAQSEPQSSTPQPTTAQPQSQPTASQPKAQSTDSQPEAQSTASQPEAQPNTAIPLTFAIVTCSDTRDLSQDTAGAALEDLISNQGWSCASHVIVKDEVLQISAEIVRAADDLKVDIVLTCGGSGLSLRDVTPEATRAVCDREVPGIAEAMRYYSLQITSRAMLSRAVCMQRGTCLVINLPGSKKAAVENWEGIVDALEHAVQMMAGGGH